MKLILLASLLFSVALGVSSLGDEVPCSKVADYDLKNSTLSVKDDLALAASESDPDALPFKNGTCELKDDPAAAKPDWRYEIVSDFKMQPVRGIDLRVIRIFENHLSGSGSWDRLIAFKCKGGRLEKIWQKRFSEGIKVARVNELQFRVQTLTKAKKVKIKNPELGVYQWDNTHGTFKKR